ncbi:MAG: hypothetical protein ISQ32_06165 [Rickettsiales bacterium]|nr:hypothetical protein [Rickettsiales bacterium]
MNFLHLEILSRSLKYLSSAKSYSNKDRQKQNHLKSIALKVDFATATKKDFQNIGSLLTLSSLLYMREYNPQLALELANVIREDKKHKKELLPQKIFKTEEFYNQRIEILSSNEENLVKGYEKSRNDNINQLQKLLRIKNDNFKSLVKFSAIAVPCITVFTFVGMPLVMNAFIIICSGLYAVGKLYETYETSSRHKVLLHENEFFDKQITQLSRNLQHDPNENNIEEIKTNSKQEEIQKPKNQNDRGIY